MIQRNARSILRLVCILLFITTITNAQQTYVFSGSVYDGTNGEALIGANVYIREIEYGSSTNISGYFSIPGIPKGTYTLAVSYIGYETKIFEINVQEDCNNCLKVELVPEAVETAEVVVSADSIRTIDKLFGKPISKVNMTPNQVKQIPRVIEADLLRALQTMPGITSLSDFSSALYVRGGTPDQNLYMIDGTDVYNPEHAFGIFSTFNTNAIKKVELSKGGFGAEYGGRLSSVLDVTNLDGNRKHFEGDVSVSLLSASTTLQMPIGDFGSISGSFRRTYIDQTYAKWLDEVPDYYFYDANIKAFFDLGKNDKLTISYFTGLDDLNFQIDKDAKDSFGFLYDWGNTTGSINWKHIFSPKLFASFWITGSRFQSDFIFEDVNLEEENYLSDYAFKAALEYYASQNFNIKFGFEQKLLHERYDQDSDQGRIFIENNRQLSTGYATANWKPTKDWSIDAGLRASFFNSDTTFFNLGPRFSIKYRLTDESNLKLAGGYYHQYINRIPRLFFASIWSTANKENIESSSQHYILGYQHEIMNVYQFEVEAYYKKYKNTYEFNPFVGAFVEPGYYEPSGKPVYNSTQGVFKKGNGESYGVEFLMRKEIGELTGWISYSLSKTNHKYDYTNQGEEYAPRHNRTHVINGVLNYVFAGDENSSSKWTLGLNFVYASGQPITVAGSGYYVSTVPVFNEYDRSGESNPDYTLYPGGINEFNLPDYIRMDVSLRWDKKFEGWTLSPYIQVFNIGNRANTWFIAYEEEFVNGKITQNIDNVQMLPLLPSIGVDIAF